jgi:acetyl esterase/lipase
VAERNWDNRGEPTHDFPKLLDVSTGATRTLPGAAPPAGAQNWWFDNLGRQRVAASYAEGRTRIHWLDAKGAAWKQIADYPTLDGAVWPRFVDPEDNLYVYAQDPASTEERLYRFDVAAGKIDPKPIVSTPGFDAYVGIVTQRDNGSVVGLGLLTEARSTHWLSPAMQQVQAKVDAALPGRVNLLSCRPCDRPKVVLVNSYSDRDPGQWFLLRPEGNQPMQRLGAERPEVEPARMARVQFQRTKARDGRDLPLWITAATQEKPAPRPAVVLVHGGPWVRGNQWEWNEDAQFLASRGYVVIEPEFRGSTGYGVAHYRAGWKQWGQAMQDDVTDALRHAIGLGLVDPKRVCIAGASYGGYAALMGPVRDPGLYKCAVSWVGVTDPRLMFSVPWSDTTTYSKLFTMPTVVGDPKADAAMLAAHAPVEQAAKIKVPVLLAYGSKDLRVPLIHGEKMREALVAAGNPPEWIVYDGEGHGWNRPANRYDFWRRVEAFLAKHLEQKAP